MTSTRPIEDTIEQPRRLEADQLKYELNDGAVEIAGQCLDELVITEDKYTVVDISDSTIKKGSLNNVRANDGMLVRCQVTNVQATGLSLLEANFKDLAFSSCRFVLANFRSCKFTRCVFIDCDLSEADFGRANLKNVSFQNCQLTGTEFSNATCERVEFKETSLATIKGVSGLKNATITDLNLVELSSLLAAEFGLILQ